MAVLFATKPKAGCRHRITADDAAAAAQLKLLISNGDLNMQARLLHRAVPANPHGFPIEGELLAVPAEAIAAIDAAEGSPYVYQRKPYCYADSRARRSRCITTSNQSTVI